MTDLRQQIKESPEEVFGDTAQLRDTLDMVTAVIADTITEAVQPMVREYGNLAAQYDTAAVVILFISGVYSPESQDERERLGKARDKFIEAFANSDQQILRMIAKFKAHCLLEEAYEKQVATGELDQDDLDMVAGAQRAASLRGVVKGSELRDAKFERMQQEYEAMMRKAQQATPFVVPGTNIVQ